MPKFIFDAAINIRAYGSILVAADSIEEAKAKIVTDDFDMTEHWIPHGGGDDDFDWNQPHPEIWLNSVTDEDEVTTELNQALPVPAEE